MTYFLKKKKISGICIFFNFESQLKIKIFFAGDLKFFVQFGNQFKIKTIFLENIFFFVKFGNQLEKDLFPLVAHVPLREVFFQFF